MDTSALTATTSSVRPGGVRCMRTNAEKVAIVEEAQQPGRSVAEVARKYGVNANLIFGWTRLHKRGTARAVPGALEVVAREDPPTETAEGEYARSLCGGHGAADGGAGDYLSERCADAGARIDGGLGVADTRCAAVAMITPPAGVQVWLAAGATDMRKGFDGLAGLVQQQLMEDPFSGHLFVFRGCAGDRVKILWWDGDGLCLFCKRLERGRFTWPRASEGTVSLSSAQLSMLLEGIDWRHPERSFERPMRAM